VGEGCGVLAVLVASCCLVCLPARLPANAAKVGDEPV
jgi:hypothetical protein